MLETLHDELLATTAETLETLAFVAAMPPESPDAPPAPESPVLCSIAFDGSVAGRLDMAMPLALSAEEASALQGSAALLRESIATLGPVRPRWYEIRFAVMK